MCKKKKKAWKVKVKGKKKRHLGRYTWVYVHVYMYIIVVYADYIYSLVYMYKNSWPRLWPSHLFGNIFEVFCLDIPPLLML